MCSSMSSPEHSRVSIAIPVFNGEGLIAEALDSIAQQTRRPDEVLVFDNCSTDATVEIAARLLGENSVRRSETNEGAIVNFNRAARESTGELFAWLAADDLLAPRFVEVSVAELDRCPDRKACLTGVRFVTHTGELESDQSDLVLGSVDARARLRAYIRRPRWTEAYCMYRRIELVSSPMFRSSFGSDVLLTWWFLLRGPLAVAVEPLVVYRLPPQVRTTSEMMAGLFSQRPTARWPKMKLWIALWRSAGERGVDPAIRRVARQELGLALVQRDWLRHFLEDIEASVPIAGSLLARARRVVRRKRFVRVRAS